MAQVDLNYGVATLGSFAYTPTELVARYSSWGLLGAIPVVVLSEVLNLFIGAGRFRTRMGLGLY